MIQSVQRAVQLLELLDRAGGEGTTLTHLSDAARLKPTTAHNLLSTLVSLRYAERCVGTRHYRLGPQARVLGTGQSRADVLARAAGPVVKELCGSAGETVIVAMYRDRLRDTILCAESRELLRVGASTGQDNRFYDTATGRVILSLLSASERSGLVAELGLPGVAWPQVGTVAALEGALADIRTRGFAHIVVAQSHVHAVAVPVGSPELGTVAAVGLFYPSVRHTPARLESLREQLCRAACRITETIKGVPS